MNAPNWQRRVTNRVNENTIISKATALQFFDGELEAYWEGAEVVLNGDTLEKGTHYTVLGGDLQMKVQLQPNDRFGISPRG